MRRGRLLLIHKVPAASHLPAPREGEKGKRGMDGVDGMKVTLSSGRVEAGHIFRGRDGGPGWLSSRRWVCRGLMGGHPGHL